jgi:hypothetical protein
MTGKTEFAKMPSILSPKVSKALRLAELSGVSTALITGKGEPLFSAKSYDHILQYLALLDKFRIPFIELQTSGYALDQSTLEEFSQMGMTTVAISCVSDSLSRNREIFGEDYEDPFKIADRIHFCGMMVRLCCTMCKGYTESWESVEHLISSAAVAGIEQVSFVPVTSPEKSESPAVFDWTAKHEINSGCIEWLYERIRERGTKLMTLMHGGEVYDINGVSVCVRYCLTNDADSDALRQVIVYPNGETRYSWTSRAARLIRGDAK